MRPQVVVGESTVVVATTRAGVRLVRYQAFQNAPVEALLQGYSARRAELSLRVQKRVPAPYGLLRQLECARFFLTCGIVRAVRAIDHLF